MNGRLIIDGYCKNGGGIEIIHHGRKPDSAAICSLDYSYEHTKEVIDLLKFMISSLENYTESEKEAIARREYAKKLNERFRLAGKKPLSQAEIDIIYDAML